LSAVTAALSNALFAACIRRAADALGGYEALGEHLRISPRLLERWADGHGVPDETIFLRIVDIVLERRVIPTRSSPEASTRYRR
jgi:hypothetical protein